MKRMIVVGTSGSGKSTLGEQIGARLGIECTDMDTLNWMSGWQMRPTDELRAIVDEVTTRESWIITGNYSKVRDLVWGRGDTLIWLDYPRRIVLWRLIKRTLKRVITREKLWGTDNVERWSNFYSRDKEQNIILWALDTQPKQRREYPQVVQQPEYAHLRVIRLKHPREAQRWLHTVTNGAPVMEQTRRLQT